MTTAGNHAKPANAQEGIIMTGIIMNNNLKPLMFVLATSLSGMALADTVAIPAGQQGADPSIQRPKTGLSMDQVSRKFGEPDEKLPAVGNPPITRWVYGRYTVYFENTHVIHSVLHPAP